MAGTRYTISLQDLASKSLVNFTSSTGKAATGARRLKSETKSLRSTLQSLPGPIKAIGGAFAATFALSRIFQFNRQAQEMYDRQAQAESNIRALIQSTGGAAGRTAEQLIEQAKALQQVTRFGDEATIEMQGILLTFKNIRKENFDRTVPVLQDLATVMKIDLKSAAIQVGKAMNDPATGLSMLQRGGITFSESQKTVIKNLAETNRLGEAQALILEELESQFGGTARAAALAGQGPIIVFKNAVDDLTKRVGGGLTRAYTKLLPVGYGVLNFVNRSIDFYKENKKVINGVVTVIGAATTAWGVYKLATTGAIAVQWALNAAMSANPLGIVIAGVGALAGAVVFAWNKFEGFRGVVFGVWNVLQVGVQKVWDKMEGFRNFIGSLWTTVRSVFGRIRDFFASFFGGAVDLIGGVLNFSVDGIKSGLNKLGITKTFKAGFTKGVADFKSDQSNASKTAGPGAVTGVDGTSLPGVSGGTGTGSNLEAGIAGVSGDSRAARNVTINLDSLVKNLTLNSTTVQDGISKIKDEVSKALLQILNDANLAAAR